MRRLLATQAPAATILIRIVVGGIFLTEGIQKFLYPSDLGAGRFAKIGIPAPDMMGPFVGGIEIVCGAILIIGLLTRIAAILLLIDISVAIISTKVPIFDWPRFLGFFSYKTSALRIPEHDSRGAHRSGNVARFAFSTHRRRGQNILAGCEARCGRHELGRGEIILVLLPPSSGVRTANYAVFCDFARSRLATRFSAPPATINFCAAGLSGGKANDLPSVVSTDLP